MTMVRKLARFVVERTWDDLSQPARHESKIRVLDTLGCALDALGALPVSALRAQLDEFGGHHGIDLNLSVHHSPIVQRECLRAGIWGTNDTWGRMLGYRGPSGAEETPWT
jgi:hypothetical protein